MDPKIFFTQKERLVPKLPKEILIYILKFLSLLGKPFFIILFLSFALILNTLNILVSVINSVWKIYKKSKLNRKRLIIYKKKGLIFSALKENFYQKINTLKNFLQKLAEKWIKITTNLTKKPKEFLWRFEVFTIALGKLVKKTSTFLKIKYHPKKILYLSYLKLSLFLIKTNEKIKKIKIVKIPKLSFVKILSLLLAITFITGFLGGMMFWYFILKDLPSPLELKTRKQTVSTKIYDRNGILLYNIYRDQNRTLVPLNEIPAHVKLATIAAEDAEFYTHPGFSIKGIVRAVLKYYKEKKLTGGSTITQQLVKNALLTPEKTLIRKIKEIILAIEVELTFTKDQILEMYLNEVPYGGTTYGIQEASRTYFGKDVKNLSLAEAALLAGLPKSPTEYSPFGANPELTKERQKEVLNLMKINGFIKDEQMKSAENEEIKFANPKTDIKAPHFVMYIRQMLEKEYGKNLIDSGGLEIITSLDYSIQLLSEKIVKEELEKLTKLHVTNAAVIVLDPKTGEILAMVGSKDYFDTKNNGNVNVTLRPRQPGSSIKVINYAYALSNGMNLTTVIPDSPVTFLVDGQPPYTPKNYEGNFRGNITLRSALAESRNIPAVRVLASYGVEKMIDLGKKMGITTWQDPKNYGLSLTLGGGEVKLIDLALVYATIANYGERPNLTPLIKISDYQKNIIFESKCKNDKNDFLIAQALASNSASFKNDKNCKGAQVLDPRVAYLITDVLKDNLARSPTFGLNSLMLIPNHLEVAVKTGTSNNLRDNLTIGYNQDYVVAVWVGNNDNSPMERIASGITGATPIWNKIMTALTANKESKEWVVPDGIVSALICPYTNTLACQGCANRKELFLEENLPQKACDPKWFLIKENSENKDLESNNLDQNDIKNNEIETKPEIVKVDYKNRFFPKNRKKTL